MTEIQEKYDLGIDKLELTLEDRAKIYCFLHPTWAIAEWEHSFFDMHNIPKYHEENNNSIKLTSDEVEDYVLGLA